MGAARNVIQRIEAIREDIRDVSILGLAATRTRISDVLMQLTNASEGPHGIEGAIMTLDAACGALYEMLEEGGLEESGRVDAARVAALVALNHLECLWLARSYVSGVQSAEETSSK